MTAELVARFVTDQSGQPIYDSFGDKRHYHIELSVRNAPADTYAVTYHLHSSYFDPIRECSDKKSGFREQITSYGDYTVQAKVRGLKERVFLEGMLTKLLEQSYAAEKKNQDIDSAIEWLKKF